MSLPMVEVVELFPELQGALLDLLAGLEDGEWATPTACDGWSVKDVAAHMLGSQIGMISGWRDGFANPHFADGFDIETWEGLLGAIDRQNEQWVAALRRTSAPLLLELLRVTGEAFARTVRAIDRQQPAGPVDWAGPAPAPAWLHLAREYTEYWVHQQQIRDAVRRPGLTDRRMFHPVLDAFARALPHALRDTPAPDGTVARLVVTGKAGGGWAALRSRGEWSLVADTPQPAAATVTLDQALAWRLFTKGVRPDAVRPDIVVDGDPALAESILAMVTVLA